MALPMRTRNVHFYELEQRSYTRSEVKNPSTATFADMMTCFEDLRMPLPAAISQSKHFRAILVDWRYDPINGNYELLINKANAALSDIALRDLETTDLRKAGKTETEGIELSSHVLIRPNSDGHTATVLLTMGAGVSIKDITALLGKLSRQASSLPKHRSFFYFDHPSGGMEPDGKPTQYRVSYRFMPYAYKGETLNQVLQSGEFESMDLIAYEQQEFDTGGNLKVEERTLKITAEIPTNVTGAALRNAVRRFRQNPDGQCFDRLRIRYKTPSGRSTSATLAIEDLDAAFTRKEVLTFQSDVEAQQSALSETVLNPMRPMMQAVAR